MATIKVMKRTVDALHAANRVEYFYDDELRGFGVRVTPGGAKAYVYQYRVGGRESAKRRLTIGKHGSPWTPASARAEAARLAKLVGQGVDPAEHDKERRRQAVDLAFNKYVGLFVDGHLKSAWKDWDIGDRLLTAEAVPVLKTKALPLIKRSDIAAILDRMHDRPAAARLAHATLRKLFRWAEGRGDIERSPMDGMKAPAVQISPLRLRVLIRAYSRKSHALFPRCGTSFKSKQTDLTRQPKGTNMRYFELTETSFVGGSLKKQGVIVRYEGQPSENMRETTKEAFLAQPDDVVADHVVPSPPAGPTPHDPAQPHRVIAQ